MYFHTRRKKEKEAARKAAETKEEAARLKKEKEAARKVAETKCKQAIKKIVQDYFSTDDGTTLEKSKRRSIDLRAIIKKRELFVTRLRL